MFLQGFILIYSITASSTLVALDDFYKQILKVKDLSEGSSVAMVIVGNKADLESDREVKRADAEAKAKVWRFCNMLVIRQPYAFTRLLVPCTWRPLQRLGKTLRKLCNC